MMALQEIIERVILWKGNEQYIPSRTDPTVGLFLSVLLVSTFPQLGSKNGAKCSTYDGTVLYDSKNCDKGLQFVWKCHIIHSVLETQALLIFLKVLDEEN